MKLVPAAQGMKQSVLNRVEEYKNLRPESQAIIPWEFSGETGIAGYLEDAGLNAKRDLSSAATIR